MKRSRSGTSKSYARGRVRVCANFVSSLFTAAATSINVKLYNDDEYNVSRRFVHIPPTLTSRHQDTPRPSGSSTPLDRTSTGILSNKPQKAGLSALGTPVALQSKGVSIMTLAKREAARRGLYSRFFRGPVLGPDTEVVDSLAPEAVKQSPPPRTELNELERTSIAEKRSRKRKHREGDKTGIAQKKRRSRGGDETKDERKERRTLKRLKKEAEKREASGVSADGWVKTGLQKILDPPEGLVQDDDDGTGYSRKKDCKKKRKQKDQEKESMVHHDG
jgi:hypothetical protein